jgi:hypothetical protein
VVTRENTFTPTQENPYPSLNETALPPAYQLVNSKTGKIVKGLVPSRRLKLYVSREDFDRLHPPLIMPEADNQAEPQISQSQNSDQQGVTQKNEGPNKSSSTDWHQAKNIVRKRVIKGKLEFLVKFCDNSCAWCIEQDVSQALKAKYFTKMAAQRRRRQWEAREAFKDD